MRPEERLKEFWNGGYKNNDEFFEAMGEVQETENDIDEPSGVTSFFNFIELVLSAVNVFF